MDPDYALFARIVEAGSLSAAARALGLSPAMVSKRLARLEARIGIQLLRRTTRRIELTTAGAQFHNDIVEILASLAEAEARLAGRGREPTGRLRITAPTSFGRLHVAPYLAPFLKRWPNVAIELDLSDGFVDLIDARIDLAIRITASIEGTYSAHRLATSRRILCAAPDYIAREGTPPSIHQLSRHKLLAADGQLPWRLTGPEGPVVVRARSFVRTNSSEVVRELALSGAGIALRSLWDISHDLVAGRLVRILPDHEGMRDVGIYAIHPRSPHVPPSVSAFIAHLHPIFDPAPPWASDGLTT